MAIDNLKADRSPAKTLESRLWLRQLCLAARDKQRTVADFAAVFDMRPVHGSRDLSPYGLAADNAMFEGGRKVLETLGVENLIFAAGSDFIEVLFPTRPDGSTVRLMDRRGGDTGYMIILQSDKLDPFSLRAQGDGVRIIHEARFPHYRDVHLHPKDTGGALLSVARHEPDNVPGGPWYPAGIQWEHLPRSQRVTGLLAAELQSEDPGGLADRWGRLLGSPINSVGKHFEIVLEGSILRFVAAVDGRGEGFSGFDLRVRDIPTIIAAASKRGLPVTKHGVTLCGMRINLIAQAAAAEA